MPVAKTRIALLLATALMGAACGGDDEIPITPIAPAQSVSETFSGTLTPFSARTHVFTSQNAGDVTVQITALDPPETIVGLSLGTSNSFACQTSLSTEKATLNTPLAGVSRAAGTLCAHIYDPSDSGLPGPVTYTLQVTHF